jgi:hypothetical protein
LERLMEILWGIRGKGYLQHKIYDMEGKSKEDYAAWVMANANSGGYRMLLCQTLNIMWYIVTGRQIPVGEARPTGIRTTKNGGRRRKRKRTKKRALKKRHRRTKRKRKRKTRRKRGGKHKLSNKKCKMLRHQHSKLIHHVNMVGKALRVQCKKRL